MLNIIEYPNKASLPLKWYNIKDKDNEVEWKRLFSHNQELLIGLIQENNFKTFVEVGTFVGNTACKLAPYVDKYYTVDNWSLNLEKIQNIPNDLNIKEQFLSNIIHSGLQDKIIPIQGKSWVVGKQFQNNAIKVDIVYIDAHHGRKSVAKDCDAWLPVGKFICGDDWNKVGVRKGVRKIAEKFNNKIKIEDIFWWYE